MRTAAMLALAALATAGVAIALATLTAGRPAIAAAQAAGGVSAQGGGGRAVIAILPAGTTVERIAAVPELAPGLISAAIGEVRPAQTFLDIGQGNRLTDKLYDAELPPLRVRAGRVPPRLWEATVERASGAPADIVPGLLGSALAESGVPVTAEAGVGLATLIGVDRGGAVRIARSSACELGCGPGLSVIDARPGELGALARGFGGEGLLIAIAPGRRPEQQLWPAGIAGPGFGGDLTSASTRTDGLVAASDIAPTVLERLGVGVPDEMNGSEITSAAERDPTRVAELRERLEARPSREVVLLAPLAGWLALSALAALAWRRHGACVALRLLGPACAWAPSLLLVAAAADLGEAASAALVGLGCPALALAADRLLGGYRALALACAVTVGAHAVDVIAGSALTPLSALGPNPEAGVRFFGIDNELEAILTTLTLVGTGAWLSTLRGIEPPAAAAWFVAIALLAAAAFAPGRFGADVGAAIVLGAGAAAAAVLVCGLAPRRAIPIVVGGGALALVALFAVDLVAGGAHLSRTVLGAGGADQVRDVIDRRLELMADTFVHPPYPELLAVAAVLLALGAWRRQAMLSWFGDARAARSGYLGALVGVGVGTVANDSGSVLLVIGTIYLAACAGFFWSTATARPATEKRGLAARRPRAQQLP